MISMRLFYTTFRVLAILKCEKIILINANTFPRMCYNAPMQKLMMETPRVAITLSSTIKTMREMMQGVMQYARLHGPWAIHLTEGRPFEQNASDLRAWKCTGMIGSVKSPAIRRHLKDYRFPIISVNELSETLEGEAELGGRLLKRFVAHVECDNRALGELAARHFLEDGFTSFAYIGESRGLRWSTERGKSFIKAVRRRGFDCVAYPLAPKGVRDDVTAERRLLGDWLRKLPEGTAVFAANDIRGRQVLDVCAELGIAVPKRLSVLACDNDEMICETSVPKLSSIAVSSMPTGIAAAELLDRAMHGRIRRRKPLLITYGPTHVVRRESSARTVRGNPFVERALDCIRLNTNHHLTVEALAKQLHISRRMLEIQFRKALGCTVKDEIMRQRLELTKELLAGTGDSLESIAATCGFSAFSHFSTAFKRRFGITPSAFRRQR